MPGTSSSPGRGMLKSAAVGALAGAAATLAMSPLMAPRLTREVARRVQPVQPLDAFPPRRIIQVLEERATGEEPLPDTAESVVTWTAHLGYGMAMGALFGALRAHRGARPSGTAAGVLFGIGVWAAGYVGWLPLLGVREGTVSGDRRDMAFPLAAHVVYGATAGALHERMR